MKSSLKKWQNSQGFNTTASDSCLQSLSCNKTKRHSLSLVIRAFSHPITRDYSALPNTDGLCQGALKKGHQLTCGALVQSALQIINKGCIMIIVMQHGEGKLHSKACCPGYVHAELQAESSEQLLSTLSAFDTGGCSQHRTQNTRSTDLRFSRLPGVHLHLPSMLALHFVYLYFQKLNR